MINQQIFNYILNNFSAGFSKEATEKALLDSGWAKEDIDAAFYAVDHPETIEPSTIQTPVQKSDQDEIAAEVEREYKKNCGKKKTIRHKPHKTSCKPLTLRSPKKG